MRLDGPAVAACMAAGHLDCCQVAQRMRKAGLPGTTPHWVGMAQRGRWDSCPDAWLAALAIALGTDAAALVEPAPRLVLIWSAP